jgi:hypothetical protein
MEYVTAMVSITILQVGHFNIIWHTGVARVRCTLVFVCMFVITIAIVFILTNKLSAGHSGRAV